MHESLCKYKKRIDAKKDPYGLRGKNSAYTSDDDIKELLLLKYKVRGVTKNNKKTTETKGVSIFAGLPSRAPSQMGHRHRKTPRVSWENSKKKEKFSQILAGDLCKKQILL